MQQPKAQSFPYTHTASQNSLMQCGVCFTPCLHIFQISGWRGAHILWMALVNYILVVNQGRKTAPCRGWYAHFSSVFTAPVSQQISDRETLIQIDP